MPAKTVLEKSSKIANLLCRDLFLITYCLLTASVVYSLTSNPESEAQWHKGIYW